MKKLLLFIFLLCFSLAVRSQSAYIPFPGSMIIYGWTQTDYSSPPSVYETHRVEVK